MDTTFLIGLAVVGLGTVVGGFLMFGQRSNSLAETVMSPGTIPAPSPGASRDLSSPSGRVRQRAETPESLRPPVPRGLRSTTVRIPWYQRLRSGLVLVLITVGIGMAIGAVLGAAAMLLSLVLG